MTDRILVAISVGDSPELGPLGYGAEHLDEATMRIAANLLGLGVDLAYGGVLRDDSFTNTMLEVVRGQAQEREEAALAAGTSVRSRARMINYQSWPYYAGITAEVIATNLGFCRYVKVDPPGHEDLPIPDRAFNSPRQAWLTATALTRMREQMVHGDAAAVDGDAVPAIAARVVLGGKVEKWAGVIPGIVEEIVLTLRAGRPVYVLGGFGGAAKLMVEAMRGASYPDELTFAYHEAKGGRFASTLSGFDEHGSRHEIEMAFADARATLEGAAVTNNNGLSPEENRELATTEDLVTICRLVKSGLRTVLGLPDE